MASDGSPSRGCGRRLLVEPGVPFCAQTLTVRRPLLAAAYDWLEVIVIRAGTALVRHGDVPDSQRVREGGVVFLMPDVPCEIEPDGQANLTRVFVWEEFMETQIWLQNPPVPKEATNSLGLLRWFYPLPSQVVQLTTPEQEPVGRALDGLSDMTRCLCVREQHYHASHLMFGVLEAVVPKLARRSMTLSFDPHGLPEKATLASMRELRPLSDPVRTARRIIQQRYTETLPAEELAVSCHTSVSALRRAFREEMGKTLLAYRDSLRVQHMKLLLAHTGQPIAVVTASVGWAGEDQAVKVFKDAVGMLPSQYRLRYGDAQPQPAYPIIPPADLIEFQQ